MSRINITKAWLILLLMPALVTAQNNRGDRSRGRSDETRVVQVERSVKRTKTVQKKKAKRPKRDRVREDKVTRSDTKARTKSRRNRQDRKAKAARVKRSNEKSRQEVKRRDKSRNVKAKVSDRRRNGQKQVKRDRVKRKVKGHKRVKRQAERPKRAVKRAVRRAVRWATGRKAPRHHVRHHSHSSKRYVYRHRRYRRHRHHGVSIGFYIRVPSIRWRSGHTRRFVYNQSVIGHPMGDVEVQSTIKRKIRRVNHDYVEVEFELDRLAVTSAGRFMGEVDRFPGKLRKVRAKIYRDGFVEFDRMLYVVGNDLDGFELLSTRYCGGDVARASYECLDTRSGELDFYHEKVHSTRYSRLLEPVQRGRAVAVTLVPDEEYAGFQYVVGAGRSNDGYYNGSFDYSSLSRYDSNGTAYRLSNDGQVSSFRSIDGNGLADQAVVDDTGFIHEAEVAYGGEGDGALSLHRQTEIRYLDN